MWRERIVTRQTGAEPSRAMEILVCGVCGVYGGVWGYGRERRERGRRKERPKLRDVLQLSPRWQQ